MPYMNNKLLLLLLISMALGLTACSALLQPAQTFSEAIGDTRDQPQMTSITEVASSATPFIPTSTYAPQTTPIPAATLTPTLSPPYPLTIEYLRQQEYPGSEVVIEQTLDPDLAFLFVTGHACREDMEVGAQEASEYLVKPIQIENLIEIIKRTLAARKDTT